MYLWFFFFFSSRRRHTRSLRDWSSDVCSSDLCRHTAALPWLTCDDSLACDHWWDRCGWRDPMSSTILMVIVLVVMWLVVLVPMFVRRHEDDDEQADDRSVGGARVLTRRAAPGRRAGPHRYHPLDGPARRDYQSDDAPGRAAVAASAFSGDRERRRMLRRRRRTLLLLVALTVGGVAGAEVVTGWF